MKIPKISNSTPVRFVKSLYYANRPLQPYRPIRNEILVPKKNKFVQWLKNLFK